MAVGSTPTCQAMDSIRQYLSESAFPLLCSFLLKPNCTTLACPLGFGWGTLWIRLLQCASPLAIGLSITDSNQNITFSSGNMTFDHVFSHSEVVSLSGPSNLFLNVTLTGWCPFLREFQVSQNYFLCLCAKSL